MRNATIEEARARLGDLVDHARLASEPTMITRYGKPAAVVVSAEWYEAAVNVFEGMEPGDYGYSLRPARPINGPSGGPGDH